MQARMPVLPGDKHYCSLLKDDDLGDSLRRVAILRPLTEAGFHLRNSRLRQMYDSALQGRHRGLRAVADVEAAENDVDVPFDRRLADAERFADLSIAAALDDQFQHFQFAGAQFRMRRA